MLKAVSSAHTKKPRGSGNASPCIYNCHTKIVIVDLAKTQRRLSETGSCRQIQQQQLVWM